MYILSPALFILSDLLVVVPHVINLFNPYINIVYSNCHAPTLHRIRSSRNMTKPSRFDPKSHGKSIQHPIHIEITLSLISFSDISKPGDDEHTHRKSISLLYSGYFHPCSYCIILIPQVTTDTVLQTVRVFQ
jgi:hypothetical protein